MTAGMITGMIALILALFIAATWLLGARAKKRLAAQYPPPGQMVDVNGYKMHIHCQGDAAAAPTVVLDSGRGEPGLTWASVLPGVAEFAHACSFDRAGLGWSEASPKPRTLANIVEEMHTLLARAGLQPPYVLVGHSIGGLYARYYANEHPGEVAGMVLVDAAHEELDVRAPDSAMSTARIGDRLAGCAFGFFQMLNSVGLLALFPDSVSRMWFGPIPDPVREAYIGVACSSTRAFGAMRQEVATAYENLAAARAAQLPSLGEMPLIVLSRGSSGPYTGPAAKAQEQFDLAATGVQAALAALSSNAKHVTTEDSGHYIQVERPELVIDAIRQVVHAVRQEPGKGKEHA